MSLCEINIRKPLITVHLVTRYTSTTYVFIGKYEYGTELILKRLAKKQNVPKKELNKVEEIYGTQLVKKWIKYSHNNLHFIEDWINLDDSISLLRKKFCVYFSQPNEDYYLMENNQQIWIETKDTKEILGLEWADIDIEPSIYGKIQVDNRFVDETGFKTNLTLLNKNGKILMDLIDTNHVDNYELYVADMIKEVELMKEKKVVITNKIKNGYLRKYYPFGNLNYDIGASKDRYQLLRRSIEKERYITYLISEKKLETEVIKKQHDKKCVLLGFNLYVGDRNNKDEWVDLLKIFNYLRDEHLSMDLPFLKYKDPSWTDTKCIIYKDYASKISQKNLTEWIYSIVKNVNTGEMRTISRVRGLLIRKRFHDDQYIRIHLFRNGTIIYEVNFQEKFGTNLKDIEDAVTDFAELVKKINKIDFRINRNNNTQIKFDIPTLTFDGGDVVLGHNTHLIFKQIIQTYPSGNIKYEDFYNFIRGFYPYIIQYKFKSESFGLEFKYKKISDFQDMNEIFARINELKEAGDHELSIIELIEIEFNKTYIESQHLFNQWKKLYGSAALGEEGLKSSGVYIRILKNKITIMEARSLLQLNYINKFILTLLEIYNNYSSYKNDKQFRKYILDETITDTNLDTPSPSSLISENTAELNDINNYSDINTNIGINIEDYLNNVENDTPKELIDIVEGDSTNNSPSTTTDTGNNESNTSRQAKSKVPGVRLLPDNMLGKDVRLHCKDEKDFDYEKDTCKDLCNDSRYYLRRMQRRDLSLFSYKPVSAKETDYARACQGDRQPVVMDSNPDEDPTIDKSSYYNIIKYGTNPDQPFYYICPNVWCPYDEKPVLYSKVKNIRKRFISGRGECMVGDCPYGKHQVLIRPGKYGKDRRGMHVGFIKQTHPDGFCLPCCFLKSQIIPGVASYLHYKKCLDEDVEDIDNDKEDRIYIYKIQLSVGKFGILPDVLQKLFRTKCESGYLDVGKSCYLRMGTRQNDPQSFLNCMIEIISAGGGVDDKITLQQFKKFLLGKLTPELFKSLNKGMLEIKFRPKDEGTPYENFVQFLTSTKQSITEEYMWDFMSREGILFSEGINIFIFQQSKDGIKLLCPINMNFSDAYQMNRRSIFLIKYRNYFEPIFYVENINKIISITRNFSSLDNIVVKLYQKLKDNSVEMNFINWNKILKENEKLYQIKYAAEFSPEMSFEQTLEQLKLLPGESYQIQGQVMDYYNKVHAIILRNQTYLPILPNGLNLDYDLIEKVTILPYNTTLAQLKKIYTSTKIPCRPIYKFLTNGERNIIAIMIETGRIIPVKKSANTKDSIKSINTEDNKNYEIMYYEDADKVIYNDLIYSDVRSNIVNQMDYENELYQRLKYEISNYINDSKSDQGLKYKNEIIKIININELEAELASSLDQETEGKAKGKVKPTIEVDMNEKRNMIKTVLLKILKNIVLVSDKSPNINFKIPNLRHVCYNQDKIACTNNPFCTCNNSKCKLFLNKYNALTKEDNVNRYLGMIAEELLRNKMKRDIILENRIKDIIDRTYLKPRENDIIVDTDDIKTTLDNIAKLYSTEPTIYIDHTPTFDQAVPDITGIDRDKFVDVESLYETDYLKLEPLSFFWIKYLPKYQMLKSTVGNISLYYSLIRVLNQSVGPEEAKNVEKYTLTSLKGAYISYLNSMTTDVLDDLKKKFHIDTTSNIIDIYKTYDSSYFYNINDIDGLGRFIKLDSYIPSLIDVYLFARMMKLNIIVLFKRKEDDHFKLFEFNKDNEEYIILYHNLIDNIIVYNLVQYQNNVLFEKTELPVKFRDFIFKKDDVVIDVVAKAPLEGIEGIEEVVIKKKKQPSTKTKKIKKITTKTKTKKISKISKISKSATTKKIKVIGKTRKIKVI